MEDPASAAVAEWVRRVEDSVAGAPGEIAPRLYADLREIANAMLRNVKPGHTLQPTALVHEAYLRVARLDPDAERGRRQFLALAAKAMRSVLVDHARVKDAKRRGGGVRPAALTTMDGLASSQTADLVDPGELVDLDAALAEFECIDPERTRIVELLFFGGLSSAEAADVLGTTQRTVQRGWATARAWLFSRLTAKGSPET